jgi:glycosyltransferase involved in cell wall biosynthesis
VISISLSGAAQALERCIARVLAFTPGDVPIVLSGPEAGRSEASASVRALQQAVGDERDVVYLSSQEAPESVAALTLSAPADVVLLGCECEVAEGWFDGLRQAAYVDSSVATATAIAVSQLSPHPSEPHGRPTPDPDFDQAAAAVRHGALEDRPRLYSPGWHCSYVRRSALELAGGLGTGMIWDSTSFSESCTSAGLRHVLADDVLVADHGCAGIARDEPVGSSSSSADRQRLRLRALNRARRSLTALSVVLDARSLSGPRTGTQVQVLEVIAALSRKQRARLTVVVPDRLPEEAAEQLRSLPTVTLTTHARARELVAGSADVVHRPYQINNPGDLAFLPSLGQRLIVTQQDLISFHNPFYFAGATSWLEYRRLTRLALAISDRVIFVSNHALDDALREDLVPQSRASVVHNGVGSSFVIGKPAGVAPHGLSGLPEAGEIALCIGTDFHHKNRLFALQLVEQLQASHDWHGHLVFAGPHVDTGGSREREVRWLATRPRVAERVVDVGAVSEAEKLWLLQRARLVLYPTVHEGFGLVPFEAAGYGVPCMWAGGTSLSEVLPDDAAQIVAWDPRRTADRAVELLRDPEARRRQIERVRDAGERFTWDATAERLLEVYELAADAPAAPAGTVARLSGVASGVLSEDALRLVGPGGVLPADVQRPLVALAMHPRVGAPIFRALKLGYRSSHRLRRTRLRWSAQRRK